MWIIIGVVGILLSVFTFGSIRKGKKSMSWPSVGAVVNSSEVEVRREYDPEDGESVYYYPRINYTYSVDGQNFKGNKYKIMEASMSRRKARTVVAGFSPGDQITVFYDPEKPEESVMQPGEQKYLYIFFVLGIGLAVFSVIKYFAG